MITQTNNPRRPSGSHKAADEAKARFVHADGACPRKKYIYIYIYTCMCVCRYIYIYIYMRSAYTYTYAYIYIYTHVYTCITETPCNSLCGAVFCRVMSSCAAACCLVLFCFLFSYLLFSSLLLSCPVLSCPVLSCPVFLYFSRLVRLLPTRLPLSREASLQTGIPNTACYASKVNICK